MKPKILFLSTILLLSFGCANSDGLPKDNNTAPQGISWIQIAQESLYGNGEEGFSQQEIAIRTDSEWEAFKQKINRTNNVVDAYFTETDIDFSIFQLIAVFDEVKGNGGWTIDITRIIEWSDKITVYAANLKKGNLTSVMTQPFQIIKIPVSEKEIVFEYDLADEEGTTQDYPKVIDAVDISPVPQEGCIWSFSFDGKDISMNTVYVISSQEVMSKFISCNDSYPTVDFGKNTVLFAYGSSTWDIYLRSYQLIQLSPDEFRLEANIERGMATIPGRWRIALLIPKIAQNATVSSIVNIINT
jgi:hypothetical protein